MWWRNYSQTLFFKIEIEDEDLWISSLYFYSVCSTASPSRCIPKYIKTKVLIICFQLLKGLKLVFLPHFLHDFRRKVFLLLFLLIVWLPLLREILGNMCIVIMNSFCLYICRQLSVFY